MYKNQQLRVLHILPGPERDARFAALTHYGVTQNILESLGRDPLVHHALNYCRAANNQFKVKKQQFRKEWNPDDPSTNFTIREMQCDERIISDGAEKAQRELINRLLGERFDISLPNKLHQEYLRDFVLDECRKLHDRSMQLN